MGLFPTLVYMTIPIKTKMLILEYRYWCKKRISPMSQNLIDKDYEQMNEWLKTEIENKINYLNHKNKTNNKIGDRPFGAPRYLLWG